MVIYQILLILAYWIYFIGESITEVMTWKIPFPEPREYHHWRLVENSGLIGVILLLIFAKPENAFYLSILSGISGLCIYLFIFCQLAHDSWKFKKTWKWLGIPFPSWQLKLVILIISILFLLIIIL